MMQPWKIWVNYSFKSANIYDATQRKSDHNENMSISYGAYCTLILTQFPNMSYKIVNKSKLFPYSTLSIWFKDP